MTLPKSLESIRKLRLQRMPSSVLQIKTAYSGDPSHPDYRISIEPTDQRVKMVINGIEIASSTRSLLLKEDFHLPVYYLPPEDVRMDLMIRTSLTTYCPFKGYAAYWTLMLGDQTFENVIWSYEDPLEPVNAIQDYVSFDLSQPQVWYQDGEALYADWLTTEVARS